MIIIIDSGATYPDVPRAASERDDDRTHVYGNGAIIRRRLGCCPRDRYSDDPCGHGQVPWAYDARRPDDHSDLERLLGSMVPLLVAAIVAVDHFSRAVVGFAIFLDRPTSADIQRFLDRATRTGLVCLLIQPVPTQHGARRENSSGSLRCGSSCECEAEVRAEISMAEAESVCRTAHRNQGSSGREAPPHCRLLGGPKAPARCRAASRSLIRDSAGTLAFYFAATVCHIVSAPPVAFDEVSRSDPAVDRTAQNQRRWLRNGRFELAAHFTRFVGAVPPP